MEKVGATRERDKIKKLKIEMTKIRRQVKLLLQREKDSAKTVSEYHDKIEDMKKSHENIISEKERQLIKYKNLFSNSCKLLQK